MNTLKRLSSIETPDEFVYAGKSSESKPTDCRNGSIYKEVDTGYYFIYDGSSQAWKRINLSGEGGGGTEPVYGSLTATENGVYDPGDYNYDAFDSVTVNVSGGGGGDVTPRVAGLYVTGDYTPQLVYQFFPVDTTDMSASVKLTDGTLYSCPPADYELTLPETTELDADETDYVEWTVRVEDSNTNADYPFARLVPVAGYWYKDSNGKRTLHEFANYDKALRIGLSVAAVSPGFIPDKVYYMPVEQVTGDTSPVVSSETNLDATFINSCNISALYSNSHTEDFEVDEAHYVLASYQTALGETVEFEIRYDNAADCPTVGEIAGGQPVVLLTLYLNGNKGGNCNITLSLLAF